MKKAFLALQIDIRRVGTRRKVKRGPENPAGVFVEAYIARQPIFKRDLSIFGYELLFRGGASDKQYTDSDADQATSRVVMESFYSRGVESITGGKPAFINFTTRLLLENTATLFPKEHLIVEILENVAPTPEIVEACRELSRKGYRLAMDDFVYRPEYDPLISISRIIKFDFLNSSPKEIKKTIKKARLEKKWLLAEKIQTIEDFQVAVDLGFSLFQGYFFSKPVTLSAKALSPLKVSYISLLKEINSYDYLDYHKLAETIRNDVALSYRLLKLVNSAYYGLRTVVKDISQALTIIGTREIRKWIFMIALMGLSVDKPDELIKMSMIRGRFLEHLNSKSIRILTNDTVFQTGLFSMLDVLMGMPMESAFEGMYLDDEVYAALVDRTGTLYALLELVISLEHSDWDRADELTSVLQIKPGVVTEEYLDAVKWCNQLHF